MPLATERQWRPAAGTFDGWPAAAAELRVLDPCCGSGHFLVAALRCLAAVRQAEEGLSAADAVEAVLRDNLHGLEIDERCCQIAAFALALAAWTYPDSGGYRELPEIHIACTGIGPRCSADEWVRLAEESGVPMPTVGRDAIRAGLLNLHRLFSQAPVLGSLIDPSELPGDLIVADYETIQPYLAAAMSAETSDYDAHERAVAAAGMVRAADLLAGEYTLVITNVPYLGRNRQNELLKSHLESRFRDGKADLATAFVLRGEDFCTRGGSVALVTPQNWLFLARYKQMRKKILRRVAFAWVVRLGEHGFDSPQAAGAFTAVTCISCTGPKGDHHFSGIDVGEPTSAAAKAVGVPRPPLRGRGRRDAASRGRPAVGLPLAGRTRPRYALERQGAGAGRRVRGTGQVRGQGWDRLHPGGARRRTCGRPAASAACRVRHRAGRRSGRLAAEQLLPGTLRDVRPPAVRLAYLGRPEARRLPCPGELPQALRVRQQGT